MEQELDLHELIGIIRKRVIWLFVIPILSVAISAAITIYAMTPIFEASTTLLVARNLDESQHVYEEAMLNRQLVSTYTEIARSRLVTESVIDALNLDMSVAELAKQINISVVQNTEIIAVKVSNPDPALAKRIANQVAKSFSEKILGYSYIINVTVVDEAIQPEEPISPSLAKNVILAGFAGIFFAFVLIFVLAFLDNTIKTTADIENYLGLTALAVVSVNNPSKGGRRNG